MSQYAEGPGAGQEIESRTQLVSSFHGAGKPKQDWRIGTEYELLAVDRLTGRASPFSGVGGIERLLERTAGLLGWDPIEESGRIIGLKGHRASVALEPGGQVELSGDRCETIHDSDRELRGCLTRIVEAADAEEIGFLQLGMQPVSRLDDIEWVPKTRYRIMAPWMARVGTLGHRMMKQTASIQVNFDFSDEADAMRKFRAAMGTVPILTAMFANSPISDGDLNRFFSMRGHVWTRTDPARCGLLPFAMSGRASFEEYVDYALDVPMYFIVRSGRWVDMTGIPFRRFLEEGHEGQRATMGDWAAHLTTLFPEVRIKTYLEIRCVDSQPFERMLAVPALVKGIFYEPDAAEAAWDVTKAWSWDERLAAYEESHRCALDGRVRRVSMRDLAREILAIAEEGLNRQDAREGDGPNEAVYLQRLRDDIERGRCPAADVIEAWKGPWKRDPRRLAEALALRLSGARP